MRMAATASPNWSWGRLGKVKHHASMGALIGIAGSDRARCVFPDSELAKSPLVRQLIRLQLALDMHAAVRSAPW